MNMRRLFRAALLATVLTTAACGGGTDPDPVTPTPDAGPGDSGNPDPVPTAADSDGDGLPNTVEDKDGDTKVDLGETDPNNRDSDCDGLIDGPSTVSFKGEDQNANGAVDAGETDALKLDSDGDGLTDGVERGVTTNLEPTKCPSFTADADPTTTTDPATPDSDGDGVSDGAEDTNQDGKVDPGELNPKDENDATGPAAQVCTAGQLRPVAFRKEGDADLQVALPEAPRFGEITPLTVGGAKVGFMGYDSSSQVAFLVYRAAATGSDVAAAESSLRTKLQTVGALSNVLTQNFQSWDGYSALKAQYSQAGSADLKVRANALANALLGSGSGSLSPGAPSASGFRLQAQYVRRSANSLVVLIALTPASATAGEALFTASDLAGGSALAQFVDTTAAQCERFAPGSAKVDFLFVVDDSGSMANKLNALGNAATTMAELLGKSTLDWRIALVTSQYHFTGGINSGKLRGFTRDIDTFKTWLTKNPSCTTYNSTTCATPDSSDPNRGVCRGTADGWVGICGSGNEGVLGAARKATDDLTPGTTSEVSTKIRADANLVVVLLGDADDQTSGYTTTVSECGSDGTQCESPDNFSKFFLATGSTATTKNKTGKPIAVHGIICPVGQACNEFNTDPQRHGTVVSATNGIKGDIAVAGEADGGPLAAASIRNAMEGIVSDAIAKGGYKTLKSPIGASIKVALDAVLNPGSAAGQCNPNDIPRSRQDGFDFSGAEGTVSFYGACRPSTTTRAAAVSYRYWVDGKSDPDGKAPCFEDPKYSPTEPDHCEGNFACSPQNACVCVQPTTACPAGQVFDNDPASSAYCTCRVQIG